MKEKLSKITEYYSPKILVEVNDVFIKLVKIKANKVPWHNHKNGNNYENSVTDLHLNSSNIEIKNHNEKNTSYLFNNCVSSYGDTNFKCSRKNRVNSSIF